MALHLPLSVQEFPQTACVGNFLTPNTSHLAILNSRGIGIRDITKLESPIVYDQLYRLGKKLWNTVSLVTVPYFSNESSDFPVLDIIAVHKRSYTDDSQNEELGTDEICFKRFDRETEELTTLGSFRVPLPRKSGKNVRARIVILPIFRPGYGILAFSNGYSDSVYLIDPLNAASASAFQSRNLSGTPIEPYFVSAGVIALVHEKNHFHVVHYVSLAAKRSKSGKLQKFKFKLLVVDRRVREPIRYIGPAVLENSVVLITKRGQLEFLTLRNQELQSTFQTRLPVCDGVSDLKCSQLETANKSELILLFNNSEAVKIRHDASVCATPVRCAKRGVISLLKANQYYSATSVEEGKQYVCQYSYDPHQDKVLQTLMGAEMQGADDILYSGQDYNPSTGSVFWSSAWNNSELRDTTYSVRKSRRTLGLKFERIICAEQEGYAKGIWLIDGNAGAVLFSTSSKTHTFYLIPSTESRSTNTDWVEFDARTLAASPDMQVTDRIIVFPSRTSYKIELTNVLFASIDGSTSVVANSNEAHIICSGVKVKEFAFQAAVTGIACCEGRIAILTIDQLYVYEGLETLYVEPLDCLGTCIDIATDGQVLVGHSDGSLRFFPSRRRLEVFDTSVTYIKYARSWHAFVVSTCFNDLSVVNLKYEVQGTTLGAIEAADSSISLPFIACIQNGLVGVVNRSGGCELSSKKVSIPCIPSSAVMLEKTSTHLYSWGSGTLYCSLLRQPYVTTKFSIAGLEQVHDDCPIILNKGVMLTVSFSREENLSSVGPKNPLSAIQVRLYLLRYSSDNALVSVSEKQTLNISLSVPSFQLNTKFVTPSRFVVFTDAQTVAFEITCDNELIQLGPLQQLGRWAHTEKWLWDSSTEYAYLMHPSGFVNRSSADISQGMPLYEDSLGTLPLSAPYHAPTDSVSDAIILDRRDRTTRFAISLSSARYAVPSSVAVFEVDENLSALKELCRLPIRKSFVQLLETEHSYLEALTSLADSHALEYLKELIPDFLVGTSDEGLSLVSLINDKVLLSNLQLVENRLHEEYEMPGASDSSQAALCPVIDGLLISDALEKPSLHHIFTECNLNPIKLSETIRQVLR